MHDHARCGQHAPDWIIRVIDSGPGFDSADLDVVIVRGVGLSNVRDRLLREYAGHAEMRLLPQGIELSLPLTSVSSEHRCGITLPDETKASGGAPS